MEPLNLFIDHPFACVCCDVVYNDHQRPVEIICEYANDSFAKIFQQTSEDLHKTALSIPNFDLLGQLNGDIPPQTFYQHQNNQYKVEIKKTDSGLMLFFIDITVEIQIHSHQTMDFKEKTMDADEQFLRILYTSEDAMLLIEKGIFIECNETVAHFLGYKSKADFLMQPPAALSPEYQPCGTSSAKKAERMNAEALRKGYHRFEWIHLKSDGSPVPVEVSLTSMVYQGRSIMHCVWRDLSEQKKMEQELMNQQEKMLLELSAPITQLWKNILLLPLVGGMTVQRAQKVTTAALERIASTHSKVLIIDINGIGDIDNNTAHSLIQLSKAVRLMGCSAILSGIKPNVAQSVVEQGLDVSVLRTFTNLQDALGQAMALTE